MTRPASAARVNVVRATGTGRERGQDEVVVEEPMEIRLAIRTGGREETRSLAVTMRTPGNDFELAAGFLFTEGIVHAREDVERIEYCIDEPMKEQEYNIVTVTLRPGLSPDPATTLRNFYTTSSCGVCGKSTLEAVRVRVPGPLEAGRPPISADLVASLPGRMRGSQGLFTRTGGIHAAALFSSDGTPVSVREDVGRHNAVDKVIGERFLEGAVSLPDTLLVVSGRASFEIVQKAAVAGIPVIAAVGAPSSLAVDLAREVGMTLLGFVREGRFNVYADASRLGG